MILTAVARNPLFFSAALPLKSVPPLFNRYEGGEHYGNHIDGAVRAVPGSSHFIRTDLSSTLFLTDPAEYDGGELVCPRQLRQAPGQTTGRRPDPVHLGQPASREPGDARCARELVLLDPEHGGGRATIAKRSTSSTRPSRRSAANTARRTRPWRWPGTITTCCGCGRRSSGPQTAELPYDLEVDCH